MKRVSLWPRPSGRSWGLLSAAVVLWMPLAAAAAERIVVVEEFTATW
ncbi:MAG TPA: hypothetical protein PKK06_09145 [Phycisphaerae bacterium]|nr:hypothetical protein [Phycisphaerae bacterium]HNU45405.1 hypothetical protein [Phycisphaerae bacterium]